jgi:hypothetical protein
MRNKKILIDFDNTLHDAKDGFKDGELYGKPMKDSVEMIKKLIENGFEPIVFTARDVTNLETIDLIDKWLKDNGYPAMFITNKKIPALAYIDDRAIRFISWGDTARYFI